MGHLCLVCKVTKVFDERIFSLMLHDYNVCSFSKAADSGRTHIYILERHFVHIKLMLRMPLTVITEKCEDLLICHFIIWGNSACEIDFRISGIISRIYIVPNM